MQGGLFLFKSLHKKEGAYAPSNFLLFVSQGLVNNL